MVSSYIFIHDLLLIIYLSLDETADLKNSLTCLIGTTGKLGSRVRICCFCAISSTELGEEISVNHPGVLILIMVIHIISITDYYRAAECFSDKGYTYKVYMLLQKCNHMQMICRLKY